MELNQLKRYCGNLSQIAGIKTNLRQDGKANGTKELSVTTGGGLEFCVNASRGLDITQLRFNGHNIGFLAKPGVCAHPTVFHDSAFLGMLTTCGLGTSGNGSESQPFHGKHGTLPANHLCTRADGENIIISGTMEEGTLFGTNSAFTREISCKTLENTIKIHDTIENNTENPMPYHLLYHINFGYPFLDAGLELKLPKHILQPRDPAAEAGVFDYATMYPPIDNYPEQVFFLQEAEAKDGVVTVQLINKNLGIGAEITYEDALLPNLAMWKSLKSGDYALGIEPTNNMIKGHLKEASSFAIPAFEKVSLSLTLRFFTL